MFPENRFLADPALGKLAKWLRILGMDARYIRSGSIDRALADCEPGRILLIRSRRIAKQERDRKIIFIRSNAPIRQLEEVIDAARIRRGDVRPFSRCIRCNVLISQVAKASVKYRVPDWVWEQHHHFHKCNRCGRIYWAGTHIDRSLLQIDALFGTNGGLQFPG
ncbi:hypothetical protein D3OALGB2SA_5426 [Olavius algarvensis associated proteobacterium Delta 3]|nr:hypothetical protein D3OALGB2SA_5426 [Olavius algarvensis associated proteobacterium Delta 3]